MVAICHSIVRASASADVTIGVLCISVIIIGIATSMGGCSYHLSLALLALSKSGIASNLPFFPPPEQRTVCMCVGVQVYFSNTIPIKWPLLQCLCG